LDILIALFIGLACFAGGWIGSDVVDNFRPPQVIREEIRQESRLETTVKSEMNTYQVQQTQVWNDQDSVILSMTNQTAYSNLISQVLTNKNILSASTNWSTNIITNGQK